MWRYLDNASRRKGQRGMRFRQQFPIGPYFADFYYQKAMLVVGIDGVISHNPLDITTPS
jgi:very-short-patch-repair endonuclease